MKLDCGIMSKLSEVINENIEYLNQLKVLSCGSNEWK